LIFHVCQLLGKVTKRKFTLSMAEIFFLSCIYWVNILRKFGILLGELAYLFHNFGKLALKISGNAVS
jgi:hypothetical protein